MSNVLDRLGVPRRINAAGTLTRLGGALMAPEVLAAMEDAATSSVDMAQLQSMASRRMAELTGAEAGIVTSGASAGLTLAAAACLAGWDAARMAALPDTRAMPSRLLMLRTHRNSYDHALRLAGAELVDVGHNDRGTGAGVRGVEAWEIEAAIDSRTAGFVFVAGAQSVSMLPTVLAVMHRHHLPVIVDAAAQLPPASNLRRFTSMGADLVVFSGGKAIGGPQSSGLLLGRAELVGSALLQMMDMDVHPDTWEPAPLVDLDRLRGTPLHGIGRGFKVGKEEIVGLLCALERFVSQDEAAQLRAWTSRLQSIAHGLVEANGLPVMLRQASSLQGVPCLELQTGPASREMCRRLRRLPRPVHLAESRLDEGLLMIQPIALQPEDDGLLAASIVEVWSAIMASEKSVPVADSSIDGLTGHSKHKDVAP